MVTNPRIAANAYFTAAMAGGRVALYEGATAHPSALVDSQPFPAVLSLAGLRGFGGKRTYRVQLVAADGTLVVSHTASEPIEAGAVLRVNGPTFRATAAS